MVEPKTTFVNIIPVKSEHTKIVTKAIATTMKKLNPEFRKTMTHDNGPKWQIIYGLVTKEEWTSILQTHILRGNAEPMRIQRD